jgi:hypothetical protein
MPIPISAGVRQLLEAPNYGRQILICTTDTGWKAKDTRPPR